MTRYKFDPNWVIRPGETLREWREDNNLPTRAAAKACGVDASTFLGIEEGLIRITPILASRLEYGTQIPAKLWLKLEYIYREGLRLGKVDASD